MTLRTPNGPIGALLESLVAPSLPFRAPLGLEICISLSKSLFVMQAKLNWGPTPYIFPGAHNGCVRPWTDG